MKPHVDVKKEHLAEQLLALQLRRLRAGRRQYGSGSFKKGRAALHRERTEELADFLNYVLFEVVKLLAIEIPDATSTTLDDWPAPTDFSRLAHATRSAYWARARGRRRVRRGR